MRLSTRVAAGVALLTLGSLASDAAAGAPGDRLRQFFAAANAVIADQVTADRPQEKIEAVRRLVRDLFAFREAAEQALGAEWRVRTPAERAEFVALFADVVESSFVTAIASRARLDGGAQVTVLGESEQGDSATVRTVVAARSGTEIQVDYRMRRLGGRWTVGDVDVDGVSLVDNYRAQMRRIVDRVSYNGLLNEMRARARGGPGMTGAEAAALPAPPGRSSQTAAVAGSTMIDAGVSPTAAAGPVSRTTAPPIGSPAELPGAVPAVPPVAAASTARPASATTATITPAPVAAGTLTPPPTRAGTTAPPPAAAATTTSRPASAPAKVAAAPPPATPSQPPAKPRIVASKPSPLRFWVQVGAFRTLEAASRLTARLSDQPIVVDMTESREPLLRVLVGPFRDHAGAAAMLRALKAKGFQPFIAVGD